MGRVKSITDERKVRFCTTFKKRHPITDDGFEYLDCMLYMKKKDGKKLFKVDDINQLIEKNYTTSSSLTLE